MPRANVFNKDDIISAALAVVEKEGEQALSARKVAARAGCSVVPIFSFFENMEELRAGVIQRAQMIYSGYIDGAMREKLAFKGVGMQYIKFAKERPNLFKLLFMSDRGGLKIGNALNSIEYRYDDVLKSVMAIGLNEEKAVWLYKNMWIYTHGIATLCVTGTCDFTDAEIGAMLTDVFGGLMNRIKEMN